jgi:hypothetical protein
MRTEEEIEKALTELQENRKRRHNLLRQNIAWRGTKQALEWILVQTGTLLTHWSPAQVRPLDE